MNSYTKLIDEHWAYISKLMMTYEIPGSEIGEGGKNYRAGMRAGYIDAKRMAAPDETLMNMIKREQTVKNAFQYTSAYIHGFKHGKEDLVLGSYLLE
jgi:hypothetical protein